MAQDDYYYEIQLTNKQLVFYFMAGAAGLILSFLAGVMVGRGVDSASGDVRASHSVVDERIVPEESPSSKPTAPPAEELTYAQRLESEKVDDSLKPAAGAAAPAPTTKPKATPTPKPTPSPKATATPKPAPSPASEVAAASPKPASPSAVVAGFTIQVGAFKDKATAESVVARLKGKGFAAYLVSPEGDSNLFNVRVGSYPARSDAERIQARLRDEEKFKPFIVKN